MGGGGGVEVALFGEVLRNASGEGVVAFYPGLAGPAGDLVVSVLVRWPEGVVGVEGSGRGDETAVGCTTAHGRRREPWGRYAKGWQTK